MYYIQFKDINIIDERDNIIEVKTTNKPLDVINLIKSVDFIKFRFTHPNKIFKLVHIEYVPATKDGYVDCIKVFLDYYNDEK